MKASDYIIRFFCEKGVNTIFGYIGGMITHLVDSADRNPDVKFIQTYHEQTASIAAEGYAIESGKFGVAMATSGPGATNMLTGIADAYFDSIPVIYIIGQVNTYEYKYNKSIRQQGFQETDIVSMVKPITKYAVMVDKIEYLRYELEKAYYIATTGRKGPVVLDLPMDIQRADIIPSSLPFFEGRKNEYKKIDWIPIINAISMAKRPMVLLGGGCKSILAKKELNTFLDKLQMPVVTSLMGRGAMDENYPHYMGMVGSYGNRCANMGIANADFLLVLGSRLDTRQTGAKLENFLPQANIVHVDIDNDELIYHRIPNRIKVQADVTGFLSVLNKTVLKQQMYSEWNRYLDFLKERYSQEKEIERFVENKLPYQFMQKLNEYMGEEDIVTTDVGQNQMWAAQTIKLKGKQKYLTSGGLAPMGYAMPSAIGCAFANREKRIYSITGDGGFHIALQSLPLMSQYNLNIKLCVFNNNALGMIAQFQNLYFDKRLIATIPESGYSVPNIAALAKAYNIQYYQITKRNISSLDSVLHVEDNKPCIIEFVIDGITTVSPKLEYDRPISSPTPQLEKSEYDKAMNFN